MSQKHVYYHCPETVCEGIVVVSTTSYGNNVRQDISDCSLCDKVVKTNEVTDLIKHKIQPDYEV